MHISEELVNRATRRSRGKIASRTGQKTLPQTNHPYRFPKN